jgi:hypothetical protein
LINPSSSGATFAKYALSLVLLTSCNSKNHTDESSAAQTPPPASHAPIALTGEAAEAIDLAKALRLYYPFAREADDAAEAATACVGGNPRAKPTEAKKCAGPLAAAISAIRTRVPDGAGLTGCPRVVAQSTAAAIDDLQKRATHGGIWDTGVEFHDMHSALESCSTKFLCGAFAPQTPCTPPELEGQLGLRDDEAPSPATFAKARPGHLWLADHREVNRQSLEIL